MSDTEIASKESVVALRDEMRGTFSRVEANLLSSHKKLEDQIGKVLEQTQKTNGRVTALELWRAGFKGGIAAVLAVLAVPGVIWVVVQLTQAVASRP